MRTPHRATSGGRITSAGKTGRAGKALLSGVLAICLAGAMAVPTLPAEAAKPKPPVIPSKAAVERAKQAAASKASQVAAIERQLAAAGARLEQLGVQSGIADEAYNGAVYRLQQAKAEAAAAAARAAEAQKTLTAQRQQIGRFAAASYQGGGDVAKIAPLFTAEGPQQLLDSAGAVHSVSAAMQGSYLRFTATQVMTNLFKVQADQAVVKVKKAADEAAKAKKAAEDAEAAQSAAVTAIGVQRKQSIAQLATLQNISVRVAAQRQQGLEELARQRAAAIAAKKAAELKRRIAAREAAERRAEAAERAREAAEKAREEREEREQNNGKKNPPKRHKPSTPSRHNHDNGNGNHSSRKGASAAIEFAMRQLGDMYLWGATGPSRWDCSGLTQGAWEQAGVQLPHYSVAQYEQIQHIDEDELRPGDLIFWSLDPNDPGTIHHVAMYLGNGRMIHAPRTGKPVQIDSVYYWEPPDFFGRP
ncbi:cell wall-associated NlpC family hydrolase [Kribbella sp. VKM Ac-2571]|uniref:C40 family peptidase n=1 Tax=Kribbella sp. VKM Ac-2571 TaxID=2512222 RepID=UPI00105E8FC0|nr:C40 family peptidase [Kribbella sp. VKM Ac-2571]TDO62460.1 cell wall-associated NlpC family hydrolase [Kribbella sp. VKM Ac-2571]